MEIIVQEPAGIALALGGVTGESPKTTAAYRHAVRGFIEFCGAEGPSVDRVAEYIDSLRGRVSAASVNLAIAGLRKAFGQAARAANLPAMQLVAIDHATRVKRDRPADPDIRVVSPADRVKLVAAMPNRLRLISEFLYATGARVSEALETRREFVRMEGDTVSITLYGKNRKERRAHIPFGLWEAITAEFGTAGVYLFQTRAGNPFRRQYVSREIARTARRVLGIRLTAHDLRHSRATDLYKASGRLVAVQRFLGHSSSDTTARYYTRDAFTAEELLNAL